MQLGFIGELMDSLDVDKLEVSIIELDTQNELVISSLEGDQGDEWNGMFIDVEPTNRLSAVQIKGFVKNGSLYGDIAVDDLFLKNGFCFEPSTTSTKPSSTTTYQDPEKGCDFESGWCNWNGSNLPLPWIMMNGSIADHTTSTENGHFVKVQYGQADDHKREASLSLQEHIKLKHSEDLQCIQFYYKLNSAIPNTLSLQIQTEEEHHSGAEGHNVWQDGEEHGYEWILGQFQMNEFMEVDEKYYIFFKAEIDKPPEKMISSVGGHGDTFIDDIDYIEGKCLENDIFCSFEDESLCGWYSETVTIGSWIWTTKEISNSNRPYNDHSYQTEYGHYMLFNAEVDGEGSSALLVSPTFNPHQSKKCLKLFFDAFEMVTDTFTLNIYTRFPGENLADIPPLASVKEVLEINLWVPLHVTIPPTESEYQIVLEGKANVSRFSLSLDDIELSGQECAFGEYSNIDCDFEISLCSWFNVDRLNYPSDNMDWIR